MSKLNDNSWSAFFEDQLPGLVLGFAAGILLAINVWVALQ